MKILIVLMLSLVFFASNVFSWEDKRTHPTISEFAAEKYFGIQFMDKLVNGRDVRYWVRNGAELEDAGTKWQFINGTARSLNHFHVPTITNPTKNILETAGLSDRANGMSAVLWAQSGLYQISKGWDDWSWSGVRTNEYNYLTSLSKTEEDANLAKMLKGLGYQMHLIQDMGHPSHVRNNTHILDGAGWGGFETWAAKNDIKIIRVEILDKKDAAGNDVFPIPDVIVDLKAKFDESHGLSPVARLFDTRSYLGTIMPTTSLSQGLSEYTNGNFFSQDTIFAAERFGDNTSNKYYFPYPRKDGTDVQQLIEGKKAPFISKTGEGETITHLASAGVGTRFWRSTLGAGKRFYGSFKLDDACYLDYAQKLIPRAVGYSKAMLDYFFRSDLTVSIAANKPPTNNHISLNVRNSTLTSEVMNGGSIELIVIFREYKKTGSTEAGSLIPDADYQFRKYALTDCSRSTPVCSIDTSDTVLDFDLSANPLPPLARDFSLIVVYRGKLGNELDSVAYEQIYLDTLTGDFDLSLPTKGVYASKSGESTASVFDNFAIAAKSTSSTSAASGNTELLVIYREALGNPFMSQPVVSSADIKYVSATIPTQGVSSTAKIDLAYSLAATIPVMATNIYVYVIHTDNSGKVTFGYRDISEPTPVDVFNNADKICINNQWYTAGSAAAIALADSNGNSIPDLFEPYGHNITDILDKDSSSILPTPASADNYTFSSPSLLSGGNVRRLGYILTDYSFKYSFLENWVSTFDSTIYTEPAEQFAGTAVKNQTDSDGNYIWPGMYTIRGQKMWWGAGIILDNAAYPVGSTADDACGWSNLP